MRPPQYADCAHGACRIGADELNHESIGQGEDQISDSCLFESRFPNCPAVRRPLKQTFRASRRRSRPKRRTGEGSVPGAIERVRHPENVLR